MRKIFPVLCLILLSPLVVRAQFTTQGKIEYERKINVYHQLEDWGDDDNNDWIESVKSQVPKFRVNYFDLYFDTVKSIYKPGRVVDNGNSTWGTNAVSDNVVESDFINNKVTAAKEIYERKFLVKDSLRKLKWRITDEIRTIADYKCHKAVSKICDSVYVVAFYTDDIMVSGGPEMFSGLPGMILELAIPRLYTTWVATKIEITPPKPEDFAMEEKGKGKEMTQAEMTKNLQDHLKDWGKYGNKVVWWGTL